MTLTRRPRRKFPGPLNPSLTNVNVFRRLFRGEATGLTKILFGEETVANIPVSRPAGLDIHVNVSFRTNSGVDRPEVKLRDGRVGGLLDPDPGISILNREIVIGRAI